MIHPHRIKSFLIFLPILLIAFASTCNCQSPTISDSSEVIPLEIPPKPVNLDKIAQKIGYPEAPRKKGIQGKVVLIVLVDEKGKYKKHVVSESSNPVFLDAVESHIHKLRVTPGQINGKNIKCWITVPFNFSLTD